MTHDPAATSEPSLAAEAMLAVLTRAMGRRVVDARRRVLTSRDSFNPDEGLALLDAYVAIEDACVRQAILDVLTTIAEALPRPGGDAT